MKLSMVIILVALFGSVFSVNQCNRCTETEKDDTCSEAGVFSCSNKATDKCYSITYKKTSGDQEFYKKGCATPAAGAATNETAFDLAAGTVTDLKAEWCDTDSCKDFSPRLTCKTCADAPVDTIDTLCDASKTSSLCGVGEQCASVFYMASRSDTAFNQRMCKEFSEPKEWECEDKTTQYSCGIKFCKTDNCEDYSSSMATTIALPLLLVAIFNAYF